jgi:hypothetical protein
MYPVTPAFARAHRLDLRGCEAARGTVRFPLSKPVPAALVRRIVRARAADLRAARSAGKRKVQR